MTLTAFSASSLRLRFIFMSLASLIVALPSPPRISIFSQSTPEPLFSSTAYCYRFLKTVLWHFINSCKNAIGLFWGAKKRDSLLTFSVLCKKQTKGLGQKGPLLFISNSLHLVSPDRNRSGIPFGYSKQCGISATASIFQHPAQRGIIHTTDS